MNGNNGKSNDGPNHQPKNNFGIVKNQGRNAFANESVTNTRSRANAISEPQSRERANALFQPATRNRSNDVFGAPEGFGKITNTGRQNSPAQHVSTAQNSSFGIKEQLQNLGRSAFAKNPDRASMSFGQKTGFNLMSGFMDKLINEANKPNPGEANPRPGFLKPPGNTGFNPNGENDDRRMSMQAQPKSNDDNVTAGEFFKRLQTAMQDPAKFKRDAQLNQQARAAQQHQSQQNQPQQNQQQQRQQAGAPKQQQQPTAQDFFKELRGALKDPAGYKRRVEAQQRSQQQQQNKQPSNQPAQGTPKNTTNHQPQNQQQVKANTPPKQKPIKKSPRK